MSNKINKQKNKQTEIWFNLVNYFRNYWVTIIIAFFASISGTMLTIIGPNKLSEITDVITEGITTSINMEAVTSIGLTLIGLYIASTLLSFAQEFIMVTITQKVSRQLREDISTKINRLPMSFFDQISTGDVLSRVTNDVDTISQSLNQSVGSLVTALTLILGSLFMMIRTNFVLTLAAVSATLIGIGLMALIMSKSQKYFIQQQEDLGDINGHIEEIYSGHTIVKVYNGETIEKEKFNNINNSLRDSGFKAQSLSGLMMPIMDFIGNFGYVAVCIVGAVLAINGSISFGVIVAFIMYVRYFTKPLNEIAQIAQTLQSTVAASKRIFELLEADEMEDESYKISKLDKATGFVEFKNVRFAYEDAEEMVINNFSVKAKPGQKIAIVGPTGAGKTTIVNLLMRFYEINSGTIKIDGISTKNLTRADVHDQFSMVLQDTWVFEGTIRENLVYSVENVSEERIIEACKAVGIHHFIMALPKQYDTILNDKVTLSEGQKQQITIARAMIDNKPMLILDEATSSVDTRTELQIQEAMDKLMEGRTSFTIAHRLSTIKNADIILVMKDGDIIESGKHDELLEQDSFYTELYNSQFEVA